MRLGRRAIVSNVKNVEDQWKHSEIWRYLVSNWDPIEAARDKEERAVE